MSLAGTEVGAGGDGCLGSSAWQRVCWESYRPRATSTFGRDGTQRSRDYVRWFGLRGMVALARLGVIGVAAGVVARLSPSGDLDLWPRRDTAVP